MYSPRLDGTHIRIRLPGYENEHGVIAETVGKWFCSAAGWRYAEERHAHAISDWTRALLSVQDLQNSCGAPSEHRKIFKTKREVGGDQPRCLLIHSGQ